MPLFGNVEILTIIVLPEIIENICFVNISLIFNDHWN